MDTMLITVLCIALLAYQSQCSQIKDIAIGGKKGYYGYDSSSDTAFISFDKHGLGRWHSKNQYQYGEFTVQIKFPQGFTAGVVVTSYLISTEDNGKKRDEIDFELLGHTDPSKVTIHTNYYASGVGSHEEQFKVWFDPTDLHSYTIRWSKDQVIWSIDGITIRELKYNSTEKRVQKKCQWQGSVWDGSTWATRNSTAIIPIDYSKGPFKAKYKGFTINSACVHVPGQRPSAGCTSSKSYAWSSGLTSAQRSEMRYYRRSFIKYSYMYPEEIPSSKMSQKQANGLPRTRYYRVRKQLLEQN